jgi:hypothetical protein
MPRRQRYSSRSRSKYQVLDGSVASNNIPAAQTVAFDMLPVQTVQSTRKVKNVHLQAEYSTPGILNDLNFNLWPQVTMALIKGTSGVPVQLGQLLGFNQFAAPPHFCLVTSVPCECFSYPGPQAGNDLVTFKWNMFTPLATNLQPGETLYATFIPPGGLPFIAMNGIQLIVNARFAITN